MVEPVGANPVAPNQAFQYIGSIEFAATKLVAHSKLAPIHEKGAS